MKQLTAIDGVPVKPLRHRADEIVRLDPFAKTIPHDWARKHG